MSGSYWRLHNSPGFIDVIGFTVAPTAQSTVHIQKQEAGKVPGLRPFVRILETFPVTHSSLVFISYGPGLHPVPGPKSIPGM